MISKKSSAREESEMLMRFQVMSIFMRILKIIISEKGSPHGLKINHNLSDRDNWIV